MDRDWRKITNHLYKNISPLRGDLSGRIVEDYILGQKKIQTIWIEFDMNEFMYMDPFYGEQLSTSPFRMVVRPLDSKKERPIHSIQDLENMVIEESRSYIKGAFSNSLHFTAPIIKFGKITGNQISFEMEYCLTNSDSYGMMTGTIEDHVTSFGQIKVDLEINEILLLKNQEI